MKRGKTKDAMSGSNVDFFMSVDEVNKVKLNVKLNSTLYNSFSSLVLDSWTKGQNFKVDTELGVLNSKDNYYKPVISYETLISPLGGVIEDEWKSGNGSRIYYGELEGFSENKKLFVG